MANKKTSIGGQALIEGIMMRGPEKTAMSVRNAKGEIITEEWATKSGKEIPKFFKIPIIRGIYGMITSYTTGYKCLMRSADISISDIVEETADNEKITAEELAATEELHEAQADVSEETNAHESVDTAPAAEAGCERVVEPQGENDNDPHKDTSAEEKSGNKKKDDKTSENRGVLITASIIGIGLGLVLSVFLFIFLPSLLSKLILGNAGETLTFGQSLLRSTIEGVTKIAILVAYMLIVSQTKEIKRTFMYHGAEHKTIFCYEQGLPLTVENIKKQRRFHPRCGTSFMVLMLLVGIIIGIFIRMDNVFLRTVIRIALLPLTVGIGYELIKFAGRHDNILTRIISAPGMWVQRITTKEPDESMIECAIEAMNRVIPEDPDKDKW